MRYQTQWQWSTLALALLFALIAGLGLFLALYPGLGGPHAVIRILVVAVDLLLLIFSFWQFQVILHPASRALSKLDETDSFGSTILRAAGLAEPGGSVSKYNTYWSGSQLIHLRVSGWKYWLSSSFRVVSLTVNVARVPVEDEDGCWTNTTLQYVLSIKGAKLLYVIETKKVSWADGSYKDNSIDFLEPSPLHEQEVHALLSSISRSHSLEYVFL